MAGIIPPCLTPIDKPIQGGKVSDESIGIDPSQISPEDFAQMVSNADDAQIEQAIRGVGTEPTLDRIFKGFEERFKPEKAEGVTADIQWIIKDEGQEHPYV